MPGVENFLPIEKQFNTTLVEVRDLLDDVSFERIEESGDIIDSHRELSTHPLQYWELSSYLAGSLASGGEHLGDVHKALYRGMNFGLQGVHDIQPKAIKGLPLGEWVRSNFSEGLEAGIIREGIGEYLSNRPDVDAFIGQFADEISAQYPHHAELGAGFIFMLSEQSLAQSYIDDYMETVHPQQIIDKE